METSSPYVVCPDANMRALAHFDPSGREFRREARRSWSPINGKFADFVRPPLLIMSRRQTQGQEQTAARYVVRRISGTISVKGVL